MNDYPVDFNEAGDGVRILDQTLLPGREVQLELCSREALCEAVVRLRIRGAPALGVFAAFSLCALAAGRREGPFDGEAGLSALRADAETLRATRPTAVNLGWALDRMLNAAEVFVRRGRDEGGKGSAEGGGEGKTEPPAGGAGGERAAFVEALRAEALAVRGEDEAMCRAIGEHGLTLFGEGDGVLTHCNAGRLATSRWGTALAPFYLAKERGRKFTVYADETRPLLQGARLTAWELSRAGVEVCLLCDNMAGELMKRGKIAAVFVGCDRVAANGDAANKIGTASLAVLAHWYKVPFYVLGPSSTVDLACPDGASIPIEERPGEEVTKGYFAAPDAPEGIRVFNPAFDVTDHRLITAIVTEKGIIRPPFGPKLRALCT